MRLVALLPLACAACATARPAVEPPNTAPVAADAPYRALSQRVVELRGLKEKAPIRVSAVSDFVFDRAHQRTDGKPAPAGSVMFYSRQEGVIYLRKDGDGPLTQRQASQLSIGIATALFHQHFAFGDRIQALKDKDPEAANTLEAFAMGDAELVRLLMENPIEEVAAHVAYLVSMTAEKLASAGRLDPAVLQRGREYTSWIMAKTIYSLSLVTRLYMAGGFALLNRAWEHPPTLFRHLTSAKSYVEGVRRSPLPSPRELPGYVKKEEGDLSAPQVEQLLTEIASNPSSGYTNGLILSGEQRGCRLTILDRSGWGRAMVVSSAWDTPERARQFVEAWTEDKRGGDSRGNFAKQRGTIVVATQGVAKAEAQAIFDELLSKIAEPLANEPKLGEVNLPPLPAPKAKP